jgi:hypothetical protein
MKNSAGETEVVIKSEKYIIAKMPVLINSLFTFKVLKIMAKTLSASITSIPELIKNFDKKIKDDSFDFKSAVDSFFEALTEEEFVKMSSQLMKQVGKPTKDQSKGVLSFDNEAVIDAYFSGKSDVYFMLLKEVIVSEFDYFLAEDSAFRSQLNILKAKQENTNK